MFKLFSQYDCLLIFNGQEIFVKENENLTIENACKVIVYPTGKTKAFSFTIDLGRLSESIFYKFKTIENQSYVFLFKYYHKQSQDVYNYSISGSPCQIFIDKENICFLTETKKTKLSIPFQFEKYCCKKIQNLVLVFLEESKQNYLVVFNPKSNKIKFFEGKITLNDKGISIRHQYFDSLFEIDSEGLKNKEFEKRMEIPFELLPLQFMEAAKSQSFSFAHSLLSENLQNKISIKTLKQHFSDIRDFIFISYNQCYAINSASELLLTFLIKNKTIEDIDINQ